MEYLTENSAETKEVGIGLSQQLKLKKGALIFGLKGDLGAGKTTFLQGFAKGLGIKDKITSPTFVIMNRFPIKKGKFRNFYHLDCYRVENYKEIENIGIKEIISDSKNIVCIEWPEKIKRIIPKDVPFIRFDILEGDKRKITIDYGE
ncbi:MAG: tRNA (adenosine(37)-N6)-threonylcarbamoyltransferase complex ATPase subunit type 1 TsaE [Candidatus Paceibacterota bacterium]|jgi:tRNA threonylcarbamoyladenosine biosynthesis protein TsaE